MPAAPDFFLSTWRQAADCLRAEPERAFALRCREFCVAETVYGRVFHRFLPTRTPPNPRKNKRGQNELASVAPHS
jgi:hypothetical protein